jgi:hypothetical protein
MLNNPITEPAIPKEVARDDEVKALLLLGGYLTQTAADARYRQVTTQQFDPGTRIIVKSNGLLSSQTSACGLEVQAISSSAAYMSFVRPGLWGVHFGLDTTNQLTIGGWSLGNNTYRIWHEQYGNPVWQAPSDSKLKENIRLIPSGLGFILESKPVSFRYRKDIRDRKDYFGDKFQREKVHYGFLANEFPLQDLVVEKSDGSLGIDYLEIIPFLCRAIQEQQAQINVLLNTVQKTKMENSSG